MFSDPPLALRPWPTGDKSPQSVEEYIARIHADRGGFKNVSQALLKEEIKHEQENQLHAKDEDAGVDEMGISGDEGLENEEEQKKILLESRDEVLRNIDAAQKIAKQTTDFISILMTKSPQHAPKVQDTLDENLVKLVGLGTISATRLEEDPPPDIEKELDRLSIANGWRAMDFDKTITSLQAASDRLRGVIRNESRYWTDMVRVRDNNWALCNFNNTTAMGVRFGFVDAAPQFRKTSLAKLPRKLDDGTPRLQTFGTDMNMRLRVTLEQDGTVVGRSSLPPATPEDAPLEVKILEARNSVFASELWYELNREARTLLSFNIREHGGTLIFDPPGTDKKILITVESLNRARPLELPFPEDALAESILRSLQLLLRHYHRQNHAQKFRRKAYHGTPILVPPKALPPPQNPVYSLLRPLILSARHESSLRELLVFLSELVSVLRHLGFSDAQYVLKTLQAVPPPPNGGNLQRRNSPSFLSHYTTQYALIAPRNFRIDLQITPQVRLCVRGQGFNQLVSTQYVINLLPPATKIPVSSISSAAHSHTKLPAVPASAAANPLADSFPPSQPKDAYPTVSEAVYYIRQAVVRVLIMRAAEVANSTASAAGTAQEVGEPMWTTSISGTSLKEAGLEREIKVEVLRPSAPARRGALPGIGGEVVGSDIELGNIDPKYNVAIVLTSVASQGAGGPGRTWVWLPDGSRCRKGIGEVVREAVAG